MKSIHTSAGTVLALALTVAGCSDAGETFASTGSEIVNGQNANLNEWPWQIVLKQEGEFKCGGSILTNQWVLTAGHCVWGHLTPRPIGEFTIIAGDHILSSTSSNEQHRTAAEIVVHPNYGTAYRQPDGSIVDRSLINDVALLRLNQPLSLNTRVRTIPMSRDHLNAGVELFATGWGLLSGTGTEPSDILQEVQTAVVEPVECADVLDALIDEQLGLDDPTQVEGSHVCMGRLAPNPHSACRGDSGGPLVTRDAGGNWSLVGVASWGSIDCNSYTAYTHVRSVKPWIESVINGGGVESCSGRTIPGKTRWFDHLFLNGPIASPETSACGTAEVLGGAADGETMYFTSLGGDGSHTSVLGVNTLFESPRVNFTVRLQDTNLKAAQAESRRYHLNWEEVVPGTQRSDLCAGRTPRETTAWVQYADNGIYVDIDTRHCGFRQVPAYFTSLASRFHAPDLAGVTSIYPRPNGFRVYLRRAGITVSEAAANEWHVNWQAVPYGTNDSEACVGRTNPDNTNWIQATGALYVDVNTSTCGESFSPEYLTSLGGNSRHWATTGVTSIHNAGPSGFRVYIKTGETVTTARAQKWHVNWKVLRN